MDNLDFMTEEQKREIKSKVSNMNYDDLRKQIENVDKNKVIQKLRSMGLGNIAEKYQKASDAEILRLLANNPDILKRINQLLK